MLQPEVSDVDVTTPPPSAPGSRPTRSDVAIVGGGASGTLTAIHLMASRAHDLTVTVHDASGEVGKGLAYGTTVSQPIDYKEFPGKDARIFVWPGIKFDPAPPPPQGEVLGLC